MKNHLLKKGIACQLFVYTAIVSTAIAMIISSMIEICLHLKIEFLAQTQYYETDINQPYESFWWLNDQLIVTLRAIIANRIKQTHSHGVYIYKHIAKTRIKWKRK